ncbi:fimbrial protein [Serratia odorifera]|uniref:fimbrial protein n=1 Tax=Serratia odorifera TaxID=618 RepID=UPI00235F74D9|nr:fimbrial protein [Serratia odorifera]
MKFTLVTLFIKRGVAMAGLISGHNATAASCSPISLSSTITIPPIVVQRDVPIGTRIGSASLPAKKIYSCSGAATVEALIGINAYGTNVAISPSDITNNAILALTNAGTARVADGLGVQILYNGAPLKRNTNLLLKTSAGGVESLPFSARYYQTKSAVKLGKVNATATLNLTYQ